MSKLTIAGILLAATIGALHGFGAMIWDRVADDSPYFPHDWTAW